MTTSRKPSWTETADLMRAHGVVHAEWDEKGTLRAMTIGPRETPKLEQVSASKPLSLAQRMKAQHDIRFAHSSMRPALDTPKPTDIAEPRAVRAKREADGGGTEAG